MSTSPALTRLAADVAKWTGIVVDRGGRLRALEQFVERRVASLGLPSQVAYLDSLVSPEQPEAARLINAITVGFTWFFRDPEQLQLVARLLQDELPAGRTAQVWVAGCATGEDVYTLAMIAHEAGIAAEFVGSDINSEALDAARAGRYGAWSLSKLPEQYRRYLEPAGLDACQPLPVILQNVRFVQHNLVQTALAPARGGSWDLILCRNVLIYFDEAGSFEVVRRLGLALALDRFLVLGAADVVRQTPSELKLIRRGERSLLQRAAVQHPRAQVATSADASGAARVSVAPVPDSAVARRLKLDAEHEFGQGRFQQAGLLYSQLLEENTLSAQSHLWLGVSLHLCGDAGAAARALRGALFLDPLLWPASYYLALCLERLERPNEARREYRRVLDTAHLDLSTQEVNPLWGDLDTWKRDILRIARERSQSTRRTA